LGSIDVQTAEGDSRFSEVAVEFLGIDIPDYMGRDTELSDAETQSYQTSFLT